MDVFFGLCCNICYKTDDGSLKDISEQNMKHVKDTLITFVGHADIIKYKEIYLCKLCCEELIHFDKFREMCFRHLIQFDGDKAAANNTLKTCVNEEVLRRNLLDTNNCPASFSTEYNEVLKSSEELNKSDLVQVINLQSQRNGCEFFADCSTGSILNSVIKYDESRVAFMNEEDMKNVMIRCSEDIKLETFDVSNVSDTSQNQFIKEEIDLNDEIECSDPENFTLKIFENKSVEQGNLDVKVPVVNNNSDSTKEELHVKQENSYSEGVKLERTEDEFGDGVHVAFEIANVRTVVNMGNGGNEDIRNQEGKHGMKLRTSRRNKTSIAAIVKAKPSPYVRPNGDSVSHTCAVCNKTFKRSSNLTDHQRIHSGSRPYNCTVCNKTFTQSSHLTRHERTHSGDRPYKCTVCNKAFTKSSHLTSHKLLHTGVRPYKCTVCNKTFADSSTFTTHKRIHSGYRPYKCTVCNKAFAKSSYLTIHERIHTNIRPYKCTVCNKMFAASSSLINHQRIHSVARPYKCSVCNEAFTASSSLTRHERTHSGDTPYKCTACNKVFTRSSHLTRHKLLHTGVKPYKCTVCNKTFADSSHLTIHERIHSGVRPYKCTVCNKTFTALSSLTIHNRKHSGAGT